MYRSQCLVTLFHRVYDDAKGHLVIHPLKRNVLGHQFLVNGVEMLGPTGNSNWLNIIILQFFTENANELINIFLLLCQSTFQLPGQIRIFNRKKILKRKILKLLLQPVNTKTTGQRCIQVHGLPGNLPPPLFI